MTIPCHTSRRLSRTESQPDRQSRNVVWLLQTFVRLSVWWELICLFSTSKVIIHRWWFHCVGWFVLLTSLFVPIPILNNTDKSNRNKKSCILLLYNLKIVVIFYGPPLFGWILELVRGIKFNIYFALGDNQRLSQNSYVCIIFPKLK